MIIIIAIGLVVLIISILFYTSFVRKGEKSLNTCGLGGSKCYAGESCVAINKDPAFGTCEPAGTAKQVCCQMTETELAERERLQATAQTNPAGTSGQSET
jgi:hypothetical protein